MTMWFILFVVSLIAGTGLLWKFFQEKKKREEQKNFIIIGGILIYLLLGSSVSLIIFAVVCLMGLLSVIF